MDDREIKEFVSLWMDKHKKKCKPPSLTKGIKDALFNKHKELGLGTFNKGCGSCWGEAINRLNNTLNPPKPKLVKDTMVHHDVSKFHEGAGWYVFPNGDKVRGKENAEEYLKSKI